MPKTVIRRKSHSQTRFSRRQCVGCNNAYGSMIHGMRKSVHSHAGGLGTMLVAWTIQHNWTRSNPVSAKTPSRLRASHGQGAPYGAMKAIFLQQYFRKNSYTCLLNLSHGLNITCIVIIARFWTNGIFPWTDRQTGKDSVFFRHSEPEYFCKG